MMQLRLSETYYFLDLNVSEIALSHLIPAALILAALLGYSAYSDVFRGRIIPNAASMGVFALCVGITPLIWEDLGRHWAWAGGVLVFLLVCYLMGAIKEGDVKLLAGLSVLCGPAALVLFLVFGLCVIAYGVPTAIKTVRAQRAKGERLPFGRRLGTAPGGPGIALALPLTGLIYGVPAQWVTAFLLLEAAWVGFFWLDARVEAAAEARAASEKPADESESAPTEKPADESESAPADNPTRS